MLYYYIFYHHPTCACNANWSLYFFFRVYNCRVERIWIENIFWHKKVFFTHSRVLLLHACSYCMRKINKCTFKYTQTQFFSMSAFIVEVYGRDCEWMTVCCVSHYFPFMHLIYGCFLCVCVYVFSCTFPFVGVHLKCLKNKFLNLWIICLVFA